MYLIILMSLFGCAHNHIMFKSNRDYETWQRWKLQHDKIYHSINEENARFAIWLDNMNKITELNMKKHGFSVHLNKFGDMTETEYRCMLKDLDIRRHGVMKGTGLNYVKNLPDNVDWRKSGCVAPVKDQGMCGLNWAEIAIETISGELCMETGRLAALSEQNLIDCCPNANYADDAFKCIQKYGGIDTEESYPFKSCQKGECKFNSTTIGAKIRGFVDVTNGDELALQTAVATIGPVAAAIDASHVSFQFYRSGIYNEPNCSTEMLDHIILIVGYGTYEGQDYWLVKNSWGVSWGMNGYILMSRNNKNQCGIATMASYPLV